MSSHSLFFTLWIKLIDPHKLKLKSSSPLHPRSSIKWLLFFIQSVILTYKRYGFILLNDYFFKWLIFFIQSVILTYKKVWIYPFIQKRYVSSSYYSEFFYFQYNACLDYLTLRFEGSTAFFHGSGVVLRLWKAREAITQIGWGAEPVLGNIGLESNIKKYVRCNSNPQPRTLTVLNQITMIQRTFCTNVAV